VLAPGGPVLPNVDLQDYAERIDKLAGKVEALRRYL
jgi:hypothetical protein